MLHNKFKFTLAVLGFACILPSHAFAQTDTQLQNGAAMQNLSGTINSEQRFMMEIPFGGSDLSFNTSGGTGDLDLYVKFGSTPTTSSYDCRPYANGNAETCNIGEAQPGIYHVMLRGYSTYTGANLVGHYTADNMTRMVPRSQVPTAPQGLKLTYLPSDQGYPAVILDGITYYPLSYMDNRFSLALVGYDAANKIVSVREYSGTRYTHSIEQEGNVFTFIGQSGSSVTLDYRDITSDIRLIPLSQVPTTPQELKTSILNGYQEYPVVFLDGITYYPLSYMDNRFSLALVGYDAANNIVSVKEVPGTRYIDSIEQEGNTFTFIGQSGSSVTLNTSEIATHRVGFVGKWGTLSPMELQTMVENKGFILVNDVYKISEGECTTLYPESDRDDIAANFGALVCAERIDDRVVITSVAVYGGCDVVENNGAGSTCTIGTLKNELQIDLGNGVTETFEIAGPKAEYCSGVSEEFTCINAGVTAAEAKLSFSSKNGSSAGAGVAIGLGAGANGSYEDGTVSISMDLKLLVGVSIDLSVNGGDLVWLAEETGEATMWVATQSGEGVIWVVIEGANGLVNVVDLFVNAMSCLPDFWNCL